jgi:hypothetical protein
MTAPPLVILLAAARHELDAETPGRLHTSHAPKLTDADGAVSHDSDEGGIGLPFTGAFHRLLSIRERPRQTEYLMRGSLDEVADWCLREHPTHDDALCGRIIVRAVRWEWTTVEISLLVAYPEPQVRSMLIGALGHAADWRRARSSARKPTAADIVVEEIDKRRRYAAREHA